MELLKLQLRSVCSRWPIAHSRSVHSLLKSITIPNLFCRSVLHFPQPTISSCFTHVIKPPFLRSSSAFHWYSWSPCPQFQGPSWTHNPSIATYNFPDSSPISLLSPFCHSHLAVLYDSGLWPTHCRFSSAASVSTSPSPLGRSRRR